MSTIIYAPCGCELTKLGWGPQHHTRDHFIPKSKGGTSAGSNVVDACRTCNYTKGARTFEVARPLLVQRLIGWPKLNPTQIDWLRASGFDTSEYDNAKLYFERLEALSDHSVRLDIPSITDQYVSQINQVHV